MGLRGRLRHLLGRRENVSASMVALVVSVSAAVALGLANWLPGVLRTDIGLVPVEPGLLTVSQEARGVATLGRGYTVSAYPSGFRTAAESGTLVDTITRGSPVSAVLGDLGTRSDHPIEHVDATLNHVTITEAQIEPGRATYLGTVSGQVDGAPRSLSLRLIFLLTSAGVHVSAHVPGADAVVIHLDAMPGTRGLPPVLPDQNLRLAGWWVGAWGGEQRALTTLRGTVIGIGPAIQTRGVDLRPDGRLDVHVWANRATLTLSGTPRPF